MSVSVSDRAVGRHGAVRLEEAAVAARRLGTFTRRELADALGVKPVALGRFLPALIERGIVASDEQGGYRSLQPAIDTPVFLPPEPSAPPVEAPEPVEPEPADEPEAQTGGDARVTPEEVRDWARVLGTFSVNQLASEMQVSWATAKRHLEPLVAAGIIVELRERDAGGRARWALRGAVPEHQRRRVRRPPIDRETVEKFGDTIQVERGMPVPSLAAPKPSNDKDVNSLVALAHAAGWPIENRAKHWVIVPPGAVRPIPVPSTPRGGGMVRAFRDQLRAAGLPDIGVANDQGPAHPRRGAAVEHTSRDAVRRRRQLSRTGQRRPGRRGT